MPALYDRCGRDFNITHALDCRKGGLFTQHHNELRDAMGSLAALEQRVAHKPEVCDGDELSLALIGDLEVWGV